MKGTKDNFCNFTLVSHIKTYLTTTAVETSDKIARRMTNTRIAALTEVPTSSLS